MAIGFFDSLHLGHQEVIRRAVSLAKASGKISSVFLFRNNIYAMMGQNKTPIFSFEDRIREIEALQVDKLFYIDADLAFLSLSPLELTAYLKNHLSLSGVVCGKDFTYGKEGKGKAEDIIREFPKGEIVDLRLIDGEKVSTTLLKEKLGEGDVETAARILGRHFSFSAKVSHGRGQGRKLGFPTINMSIPHDVLKGGVYFTETMINKKQHISLTNVGAHPTFGDRTENAETYILDFQGDLYEETLEIKFLHYHRSIVAFDTVEALIAQIREDEKERREYD